MTGTGQHDAQPHRPVAIWHRPPHGPARATVLTEPVSSLPRAALARLIARRVLGNPDARVVIDHVVTLPPHSPVLPADQVPLDLGEHVDEAGEQIPEVADPATRTLRVLSRRCASCIYRRAMRTALGPSVPALIREARDTGGFVICHETLPAWPSDGPHIPPAICHGYAARFPDTFALRLAHAIGRIEPIDPPPAAPRAGHDPQERA